jgi:hypothetical protein
MKTAFVSRTNQTFLLVTVGLPALGACSLAWNEFGSIRAGDWLAYAFAAALLIAGVLWSGRAQLPSRAALASLAALVALAGWDALSLRWSAVPPLARDEALLVVFYALAFVVPLLVVRTDAERRAATGVVAALLVALALATFVALLTTGRPADDYEHGRLTFPITYVNAQAALFLVSFWPCVALSAERTTRPLGRAAASGGACALLAGWLMTQSKGGLVAVALAGVVFFAVSPARLRSVVPALIPAVLVGASYELLTRPFRHRASADFAGAIRFSTWIALALVAIAVAAGFLYALVDARVSVAEDVQRRVGVALLATVAAVLVAALATFAVVVDRPVGYLQDKWQSFKTLPAHESGSSHLTSLGSNRYDFWRVELRDFAHHPLAGIGSRGFSESYLLRRHSSETPARGHSLPLDVLSETGIVGFALLAAGIGTPLWIAARRARRSLLAAGLFAGALTWIVHASVDWIWTVPAVGLPFFVLLGIAAGERSRVLHSRTALACGAVAVALAAVAFLPPWLSSRYTSRALAGSTSGTDDLRWARRLDPIAVDPLVAESEVAATPEARIAAMRRAVAREPRVSALRYLLGQAYLAAGRRREARAALLVAHRLNPRDGLVVEALRRARP